jgi:hypothetical protein
MIEQDKLLAFNPNDTIQYINLKKSITANIRRTVTNNPCYTPFFTTTRLQKVHLPESYALETRQEYPFLTETTWNTYSRFYRHLISKLANHSFDKPHLHPLTYDFLDVDGTRNNPRATFNRNTIPHIHSIYLIHENVLNRWTDLLNQQFIPVIAHRSLFPFVSSFYATPIFNLPGIVSYASKFYDVEQMRRIRDNYHPYHQQPISNEEKEMLKLERQNLPFHSVVDSNRELKFRNR